MKVSELSGARLDYWVAKAENLPATLECHTTNPPKPIAVWLIKNGSADFSNVYNPSANWAIAGPIIERERMALDPLLDGDWEARKINPNRPRKWDAPRYFGKTPMEAAMRAYVASKFGEEVSDES